VGRQVKQVWLQLARHVCGPQVSMPHTVARHVISRVGQSPLVIWLPNTVPASSSAGMVSNVSTESASRSSLILPMISSGKLWGTWNEGFATVFAMAGNECARVYMNDRVPLRRQENV
jgi:hypothetical protein